MADYTNTRGIFSLLDVRERQGAGTWATRGDVWLLPGPFSGKYNFSYVAAGLNNDSPGGSPSSGYLNRIEKYDFASDTTSLLTNNGNLDKNGDAIGRAYVSSPENHYTIGGGNYFLYGSTDGVFKTSYANGTSRSAFLTGYNPPVKSFMGASVNNTSHGYFTLGASGYNTPDNRTTNSRIDFSNDYAGVVEKGSLIQARKSLAGVGNQSYGYFGGGKSGNSTERLTGTTGYSNVDRLDYSSDSTNMSPKGPLTGARGYVAATGNASYGYFAGGGSDVNSNVSTIDRIDYASDTSTASPKGPMTDVLWGISASGTPSYGYIYGGLGNQSLPFGYQPGSPTYGSSFWADAATNAKSYVQKIDFSNDTATLSPRGNLQRKLYMTGSTSSQSNANTTSVTLAENEEKENVSPIGDHLGYFAGGNSPSPQVSTVNRINYVNDTATALTKGPLSGAKKGLAAVGNSEFGYFTGGYPSYMSTVDRTDYTNDTGTAVVKGPLVTILGLHGAAGNKDFGYTFGGRDSGNTGNQSISSVYRINYVNDTATAVAKGPLTEPKYNNAATGNQDFGYLGGGNHYSNGARSSIERIDYSSDTATALVKGKLPQTRSHNAGTGNASFGYFGGGRGAPSNPSLLKSSVDRIDYSNDTATASPKGPLNIIKLNLGATGNASFGYFGGGGTPSKISSVDRVDYSNDTATASPKGPLSSALNQMGAVSSREYDNPLKGPGFITESSAFGIFSLPGPVPFGTNFGYFGGGWSSMSTVDRVDYSNDTATASSKGPLSDGRSTLGAAGNTSFGYFGGGFGPKSTVDRVDYSNDTATASSKGPLSESRRDVTATGNASFGYFGGGEPDTSTVDRIDYSNDTATAVAKGPLTTNRKRAAATGNQNFGYFGGGLGTSRVDRVDYSNDTANASPKGPLSGSKQYLAATGNSNFGYFGGGSSPDKSTVDRIDYNNDTATASPKGPLSVARYHLAATGNDSFGYFAGGAPGAPFSLIDRVDYSNDTATASPKGPLSSNRRSMAGSSSHADGLPTTQAGIVNYQPGTLSTFNTGYFGGGAYNAVTTVDRIDYNNDTVAASPKGPLSQARTDLAATSSSSFGYFGGGYPQQGGAGAVTTIDRISYFNDTRTASVKGPLRHVRVRHAATGNADFGYFGGGQGPGLSPSDLSSVDRVDYSSDNVTTVEKGSLSSARYYLAATGNQDFGYFAAGRAPDKSTVDRIDYSSDTATASPKGPLSSTRQKMAATGNASFGYFGGGNPSLTTVDRIDYSNDTATAATKSPLQEGRHQSAATGNQDFGYFAAGRSPDKSSVERIDYSNDTTTPATKGPLSSARYGLAASGARANGFVALGPAKTINQVSISPSAASPQNYGYTLSYGEILRWSFSNDNDVAVQVASSPSWSGGANMPGMVSSTTHGYWNRDYANSPQIHRLDYSNDTANPVQVGSLISNKTQSGAVHNADYGYWTGGREHPGGSGFNATSSVQRLDFSNDTANAVSKGNLSEALEGHKGVGNMDKGYLFKGNVLTKIDYSNDTATSTSIGTGGPQTNQSGGAGAGNLNYGWLFGYDTPSTSVHTGVLRLDYANDTDTLSPRGPLLIESTPRSNGATGNRDQGYYHGGFLNGAINSVMNKVTYANDTVTAQFKKALFLCTDYNFYDGGSFSAAQNGLPQ